MNNENVSSNPKQLKRSMSLMSAISTVVGTVIGAGVFFKVSNVSEVTGSTSMSMLVWLLGGLITLCAGLTGAELAAALPETGGMLVYIERAYGKLPSFLLGWAQVIVYFPASIAAKGIIFGTQLVNLFHLDAKFIILIGAIALISVELINFLGAKIAGAFQSITLFFKLIPLALIVIFGLMQPGGVHVSLFPVTAGPGTGGFITAMGAGLLATMYAYDGWIHVGNIAGEMKNPSRDLPKAITGGILAVMAVYLFVNFVFLHTLPLSALAGNENAAMDVANKIFGEWGGKLITIGILISIYGTLNGYTLTGMRLPYVMAEENSLPFSKYLTRLNKNQIPYIAGLFELVLAIALMFVGGFDTLTDMLVFVIWLFYTLVFVGVIILRHREPDLPRPYKVPLYPWIPLIAILSGLFIIISTLFTQFTLAMIGLGVTLLGLPVYYFTQRSHKRQAN
ncbi:APA family basic amino acid/polyamine antiporter [Weissella uvarum]|uniref:APC family permease n=1 Tax=Weissella uvarum TaxID=1479233 RepID=UPI0019603A02|nr:amino acid permease [Weissella uvarum]MBM7617435.1 APA family basic amino acid/polyamine antiporter [Weissella uvarum]MCM0595680.1 amino acid permease [Weissella uvarum]